MRIPSLAVILLLAGASAEAQGPSNATNPIAGSIKAMYETVATNVLTTSQRVPDSLFAFKPTPDVRSMGDQLAHIANAMNNICAPALGVPNPHPANPETAGYTPEQVRHVVQESFALCDRAYAALTDAQLTTEMLFFGTPALRHRAMTFNIVHADHHYGNLVTYMRLKGIVPPSSGE